MTSDQPLLEYWTRTCAQRPDAVAIIHANTGRTCSRAQLDQQSRELADGLPAGLARRRVAFCCENGVEWMARLLALLRKDAVPVPLDPSEPLARQRELAASVGAALWHEEQIEPATRRHHDADTALIKLTSGSTARPRALRFRAGELIADARHVTGSMGITSTDLNLALIPCGHSYGLGNISLPLIVQGTAFVVPASPLPAEIAACCATWRPTVFPAVPAILRLLAESSAAAHELESLHTVISAGSVLPADVARVFHERFGRLVHGFYGSSETGGITYDRSGEATLSGRSVGTALNGVRLRQLPAGRLLVESAAVYTLGNRRARKNEIGRHVPADIGQLGQDGELTLTGRSGRMAKIAGRRVNLSELEKALQAVEGVRQAFVTVHPTRADELAAVVETDHTVATLRAALASRWPAWRIPRRIVTMPEFPLTARGKVDTAALEGRLQQTAGSSRSA